MIFFDDYSPCKHYHNTAYTMINKLEEDIPIKFATGQICGQIRKALVKQSCVLLHDSRVLHQSVPICDEPNPIHHLSMRLGYTGGPFSHRVL